MALHTELTRGPIPTISTPGRTLGTKQTPCPGGSKWGPWLSGPTQIVQDEELWVTHLLTPRDISSPALQPPPTSSFYFSSFLLTTPALGLMLAFR